MVSGEVLSVTAYRPATAYILQCICNGLLICAGLPPCITSAPTEVQVDVTIWGSGNSLGTMYENNTKCCTFEGAELPLNSRCKGWLGIPNTRYAG